VAHHDVIGIGASAGGVEALRAMVACLPAGLPAAVLVVLHIPAKAPSALSQILSRSGPLPAVEAAHGETLRPGVIYVARADRHLLVRDGHVHLSCDPPVNGHRPAVDPLFHSIARSAGPRGVAVVLSGNRDDGAAGAAAVALHGGRVLVQSPEEAQFPSMPRAVLRRVAGAAVARAADLAGLLAAVATQAE
jgi:two-component system chemotaxis response regulator CheB